MCPIIYCPDSRYWNHPGLSSAIYFFIWGRGDSKSSMDNLFNWPTAYTSFLSKIALRLIFLQTLCINHALVFLLWIFCNMAKTSFWPGLDRKLHPGIETIVQRCYHLCKASQDVFRQPSEATSVVLDGFRALQLLTITTNAWGGNVFSLTFWSRNSTTAICPWAAAHIRGVKPSSSVWLITFSI